MHVPLSRGDDDTEDLESASDGGRGFGARKRPRGGSANVSNGGSRGSGGDSGRGNEGGSRNERAERIDKQFQEEERRLAYVALSRAEQALCLSYIKEATDGSGEAPPISRFAKGHLLGSVA